MIAEAALRARKKLQADEAVAIRFSAPCFFRSQPPVGRLGFRASDSPLPKDRGQNFFLKNRDDQGLISQGAKS